MNKPKSTNRSEYHKNYARQKRSIICNTIRGSEEDAQLLNAWRKRHPGVTWLQLLYRGAGIARPDTIATRNAPNRWSPVIPP